MSCQIAKIEYWKIMIWLSGHKMLKFGNTIWTAQLAGRPKSSVPFYEKLSTYVSPMVSGLEAFILDYWEKNTNWKSTIIWWNNWRYIIWRSRRTQLLALFKYPLLHSCMPKEFPIFDIKIGVAAIIFHTLEKKWRDAL